MMRLLAFGLLLFFSSLATRMNCLYNPTSDVKVLTSAQFYKKVKSGNDVWLVEFFAPWCNNCKEFVPVYEEVARSLKGFINVAAIQDESVMSSENISQFPTLRLYVGGKPVISKEYQGQRLASTIVKFVISQLSKVAKERLSHSKKQSSNENELGSLVELTDSTFSDVVLKDEKNIWFVMVYAPWCGYCKALKPTWTKLSKSVKSPIKIGQVDGTVHRNVASQIHLKGFPTLVLFPSGKKSFANYIEYPGERELESLQQFVNSFVKKSSHAPQLTSHEMFLSSCANTLCLLAFLPNLLDAPADRRRTFLKDVYDFIPGGDNYELEEALDLRFGYPALIAVHQEKQKYAIHRGKFTRQSIESFISGLMTGRQQLSQLPSNLPRLKTVEAWNGDEEQNKTAKVNKTKAERDAHGFGDDESRDEL